MQRSISLVSLISIITLLAFSSWLRTNRSASAGQGKGGEVIAKPTPTPAPKKTTTTRPKTGSRTPRSNTGVDELAFWETIKNSIDPEDFKAYLQQYPKGKFAALAKNRLKHLEASQSKPIATPNITGASTTNVGESNAKPTGSPTPINSTANATNAAPINKPAPLALKSFEFETVKVDAKGVITERSKRQAREFVEDLGDGVTIEMVEIPGGTFTMGASLSEDKEENEGPPHQVTVPSFYMSKYEVTLAQWSAVRNLPTVKTDYMWRQPNPYPKYVKGDDYPVVWIMGDMAVEFGARLSRKTGREYRLPTEAEWEYACRAGTNTPFTFGDNITTELANFRGGSTPYKEGPKGVDRDELTPVRNFRAANGFGLYDMHGNVGEFVLDSWHDNYNGAPTDGSAWLTGVDPLPGMVRGGSMADVAGNSRCASREKSSGLGLSQYVGFRVVMVAPK